MKGRQIKYEPEELAWIEARKEWPRKDLHAAFVWMFKRDDVSFDNFKALCTRKGWKTGRTGFFTSAHVPHNKGRKGFCPPGCEKGYFPKGNKPHTYRGPGHEAMSCDLLPTEAPGPHYHGDVRDVLNYPWDLMIAHPPCVHLSVSGARHFEAKRMDGRQQAGASFFMMLAKSDIPRIAIENPVCIMSSLWRKPDQIIQPWQFGHGETKATCLWLKGLPLLKPTQIVDGREARIHRMPPSHDRWKERSRTYPGIASAMAMQWGGRAILALEAAE